MIKTASYALVVLASLGMVNVPHAVFYEHPQLLLSSFWRKELEPSA